MFLHVDPGVHTVLLVPSAVHWLCRDRAAYLVGRKQTYAETFAVCVDNHVVLFYRSSKTQARMINRWSPVGYGKLGRWFVDQEQDARDTPSLLQDNSAMWTTLFRRRWLGNAQQTPNKRKN